ncbi:hypothetical protein W97_07169 [Coniosporium apollinis CBS 100218]|uniref:Uncharacterized protein n=1 Tax=Coniosporium apollinis (strain CBS 100218) TaxID=1168221 RepID=R7Z1J3_CONA1|nr:uncharacterized protein W97_07169 [Coniosporium apollinis CBS 100218]EON68022.1 hypothetical protein W97_07169 [Coniosporium apollinis CBS 100218]
MASRPSISSNDVVGLLAAQGQRRRKQIYDERKGLSVPAEFEDRANRRRSMDIALGEPEPGTPPSDSTAPQLPWTPTDEKKVTLFSLEENPNYKCNPVAFSKVEILDALEQGYTGNNVLAFLNARTDLELEMMRSSRSSKHSFHTAEETDSVHAYAYNRNEPKSLYFHPNTALTSPSSTVDQATVRVESHGSESMSSAHLPFAGHAASSVSPSDKNSSSPPLRSSRKFGKDINLRSPFSATTVSEAATTPELDRTRLSAAESHRTSDISSESSEPSAATLTPEASATHEAAVAHALSALGSRGVIKTVTVEKRVVFVEQRKTFKVTSQARQAQSTSRIFEAQARSAKFVSFTREAFVGTSAT